MRTLRLAAVAFVLAVTLAASAARAADDSLSATLTAGWEGGASAGSWIPYTVDLKNGVGRDFNGTLVVRPRLPTLPGAPPGYNPGGYNTGTIYEMPVALAQGTEKRVTFHGQFVDAAAGGTGYEAQLVDRSGTVRATSNTSTVSSNVIAIGVLSDTPQVSSELRDIPRLRFSSTGVVNLTALTFPSNEALLGGLTAVVLDNFDTATLSQAQLHALQEYVGLGGSLILAGGSAWRRTLSPLPPALLPLRPDVTSTVSLAPLLDLVKSPTRVIEVPAVGGQLTAVARAVLSDRSGHHLMVEARYGSGRIVELTYNPADEPVSSDVAAYRESWSSAVNRASNGPAVVGKQMLGAMVMIGGPAPGLGPGRQGAEYQLVSLLRESSANALPALGILGSLLVGYILLAGPVNYLVLRRLRRRELMWITIPLMAIIATGGAYGAGVISHGSDYVVNELQLLRVAPDGGGDVTFYEALFSPRRGDLSVELPDGSLGGTTISPYPQYGGPNGPGSAATGDRVLVGRRPSVNFRDLTVWAPRDLKVNMALREPLAIEAHLKLAAGRVVGTLTNHGRIGARNLGLYTVDGRSVHFEAPLPPGSTVHVDGGLETIPGMVQGPGQMGSGAGKGTICNPSGCFNTMGVPAQHTAAQRRETLTLAGAEMMFNGNGLVQALVGTTEPMPSVTVGGVAPNRTVTSAFVQPVEMESVDALAPAWVSPRLVAASGTTGQAGALTVLDFDVPVLADGGLTLTPGPAAGMASQPGIPRASGEVYDWKANAWVPIDVTRTVKLTDSQRGPGVVRVRIQGGLFVQSFQIGTASGTTS